MVDRLDVDGGDVVRQQHNLVGVDFVAVLVRQLFRLDQATLQQTRDEGPGPGEGVDDVHPLAAQRLAELGLQEMSDAVDDEVHDLHRRIDDTEALGHLREGIPEELVVKLDDDFLLARGAIDAFGTQFHAGIEGLQRVRLLLQPVLLKHVKHALHGLAHGVVLGEAVVLEQGVEDRLGDQVLRQHLDDLTVRDTVVQVVSKLRREACERFLLPRVGRLLQDRVDSVDVRSRNARNVVRPVFPVVAIATLLDHLGVERSLDLPDFELDLHLLRLLPVVARVFADAELALGLGDLLGITVFWG